jgi:hypothetical protein
MTKSASRTEFLTVPRDVGPRATLGDKGPDPVRVVAAIRQQPSILRQIAKQDRAEPVVMRLTAGEAETDRQSVGINDRMDLAGEPTA